MRYAPFRRSPPSHCCNALPLDLHVLGLPLAFILSQDQTLHRMNPFILEFCLFLNLVVAAGTPRGTTPPERAPAGFPHFPNELLTIPPEDSPRLGAQRYNFPSFPPNFFRTFFTLLVKKSEAPRGQPPRNDDENFGRQQGSKDRGRLQGKAKNYP